MANAGNISGVGGIGETIGNRGAESTIQKGEFRQMAVSALPPDEEVSGTDEEISFFFANRLSKKRSSKELAKRKAEKKGEKKTGKAAQKIAGILENYLDLLPTFKQKPEQLEKFLEAVDQLANPNKENLVKLAAEYFQTDVTAQHAALGCAREIAVAKGAHKILTDNLNAAQELLSEKNGVAIRAGYNTAVDAEKAATQGLGEPQNLMNFYRKVVLEHKGIIEFFKMIRHQFPHGKLREGITYVLKASGSDLDAAESSIPKPQLIAIMNDCRQARTIGRINETLASELVKLGKAFGLKSKLSPEQITEELLSLTQQQWPQANHFVRLMDKIYGKTPTM